MYKIMIIEDEVDIRDELSLLLSNEGYKTHAPTQFGSIATELEGCKPDLILLDIGLPGRDGFALCMDIRKKTKVPIIFVTSRDNSMDELNALSLGGDDYVTKSYNVPVLLARIKIILRRRAGDGKEDGLEHNGLRLDLSRGLLEHDGKTCDVTKNEI